MMTIALANHAVFVAETVEPGDDSIAVYVRAELGVRPDHETVHLTGKIPSTVDTWRLDRAQEGTSAEAWPIGTPLAILPAGTDPTGEMTIHLAHPLAANAREVNLQAAYRRLQVGSEIIHDVGLPLGDPMHGGHKYQRSFQVERGKEGTTPAAHAAGATATWLGPGE
jgi:hypothetical protein